MVVARLSAATVGDYGRDAGAISGLCMPMIWAGRPRCPSFNSAWLARAPPCAASLKSWKGAYPLARPSISRDLLPLLNSRKVELLDLPRLATQLTGLERRTARGGKDSIDHAPGSHDDVANCVAGSLLLAQAAAPALWRQEALLIEGVPSSMPARCDIVFAVLMAGQCGDAAVVYFASNRLCRGPLLILDWEAAPLKPVLFNGVATRLVDFAKATRARGGILFTSGVLVDEVRRLGYHAEVIDSLAAEGDGLLALAAAVHIGAGRVKITAEALAKAEHHPLGGILDATATDEDDA
jgi:hypothetical protein